MKAFSIVTLYLLSIPALLLAMWGASYWFDSVQCHTRWGGSGLSTEFTVMGGCKVKLQDGRWMPEDRVREIDTTKKENSK